MAAGEKRERDVVGSFPYIFSQSAESQAMDSFLILGSIAIYPLIPGHNLAFSREEKQTKPDQHSPLEPRPFQEPSSAAKNSSYLSPAASCLPVC